MTKKQPQKPNFEKDLQQLEKIVAEMEKGSLNLEQSLKSFEQGIALARHCQKSLTDAEQRVQVLIEEQQQEQLEDFELEDDGNL